MPAVSKCVRSRCLFRRLRRRLLRRLPCLFLGFRLRGSLVHTPTHGAGTAVHALESSDMNHPPQPREARLGFHLAHHHHPPHVRDKVHVLHAQVDAVLLGVQVLGAKYLRRPFVESGYTWLYIFTLREENNKTGSVAAQLADRRWLAAPLHV